MSEFQLYKKRDFSALISDTVQFFKQFWKNYFRNYVVINGSLVLLMSVLYYLLFQDMFKNLYSMTKATEPWMMYNNNPLLLASLILLFVVIAIALAIFTTAFPMVYLKLLKTKDHSSFSSSEILNEIKNYAGRMLGFGLISMFIMFPIAVIVLAVGAALSIVIIGIPILILAMPTLLVWGMQSVYVYIEEGTGYFDALGKGWKITFDKYWHVIGSTIIIFMCVMVISSIFNMVPAIMMMGSIFTSGGHPGPMVMTPTMIVFYVIGMIFSFLGNNILYMQQGLVYYSSKENTANYQAFSDIDNIGKDEK